MGGESTSRRREPAWLDEYERERMARWWRDPPGLTPSESFLVSARHPGRRADGAASEKIARWEAAGWL